MSPFTRWVPLASLALAGLLAVLTVRWVDLTPRVDERFFFSHDSAAYREARTIQQRFRSQQLLIVTAQAPDIGADAYRRRVERLTGDLQRLPRVRSVSSLTRGPENLEDARDSPLWRRMLLVPGVSASHLVLTVDDRDPGRLVESVQEVLRAHQRPDFQLTLAGVPYVVDSIGRSLKDDFRTFSLAAVIVFGGLMVLLFRSWAVLLGSLTACGVAALLTLLLQQAVGGRIGLLTANIVTIAFVLTQSHVVFLTNNFRQRRGAGAASGATLVTAVRHTWLASSWCMVAALLGFASLLYVDAQPLRELGKGGMVATLAAILAAYTVYPPFLLWMRPAAAAPGAPTRLLRLPSMPVALLVLGIALAAGLGALRLNSDPSLLDYFSRKSEVHRSLAAIDPHGGSSPLNIAVRRRDGQRLNNDASYRAMWGLQRALQEDPAVGTVLSLPVLMAEAERAPLARLLPWEWLLNLLSQPRFDRVASGFVTADRTQALFLLRMVETGREERRTEVIARLERIIEQHGFQATAVGGIYALQGRLADLVLRSLVEGLVGLLLAVAAIGYLITRSARACVAMLACTATVPAVSLGVFGAGTIPLDIIATPGVNVAIGVAVDSMIHLGAAWRRALRSGAADALVSAQREQAAGILAFSAVVVAGFAIFVASTFPPTQRFGLSVILGAVTAGVMALWIFPALLQRRTVQNRSAPALSVLHGP